MYNTFSRPLPDEDILLDQFYLVIYRHLLFLLSIFFCYFCKCIAEIYRRKLYEGKFYE